ncbi:helicase [Lichenibacterium minor]|uniref:Helicase n=1 Tax=Lichenibacterium minor TaxID=2316528 RepID=A0A4Q2UGD3_9HYPH|nr:helicase-related protein [Lichenibacterium minor]RYC33795.1 helicase [Lichenibacterium minor]
MDHQNRHAPGALAGALRGVRDQVRARTVTAVLGPTNTGKTHFAIERMLAHPSGIIGLPLRLLAREVYGRVVEKVGAEHVALITGEEKIKPKHPRYWVCTVEAMPRDLDVSFVAIDEIQLCQDFDRGHVFTDRLLHRRGLDETLVLGAGTMQRMIEKLLPGVTIINRPRLSNLTFAGEKKLSRLPHRTAIVAFSADEVYAIAELIRRQRGGAAVVLGALSPRTRNAQVAMYQNGDVDYLVATDAIGMGLNLDVDHVAFAGERKFDGWQYRRLNSAEIGQIAGRAGRHVKDGTFGTTGRCPGFEEELVEALEEHRFDPVTTLQWRNSDLDFSSIAALQASLEIFPNEHGLTRAPLAEDVLVLDIAARDEAVRRGAKTRADVQRLWEVCQVPDYRKVSPAAHAEFALALYGYVVRAGRIPDLWYAQQVALYDRTEGDIDALSARIAQVRTLTYIANRPDWLGDPEHWQGVTRQLEDRLSDALHERLAQRFVDRRTSVLMRRLRENAMLEAEITAGGDVVVEGQHVGQLHGFRFTPDPQAAGEAAKALNAAALKALGGEIEARADRFAAAVDDSFALANDGTIRWLGDPVAKLSAGDKLLVPRARIVADEYLTGPALETVQRRLDLWLAQHIKKHLGVLFELEAGEGLDGIVRGIAFQVAEALGVLERSRVADEMKGLDQTARGTLRKLGLRFGAYHIYMPALVKPAPRALAAQLWALRHGGVEAAKGLDEVPHLAASGRTSFVADPEVPKGLYRAAGFRVCGVRAVRVDILERLADLIRPAIAYRPGTTPGAPPPGTADADGFVTTVQMTSLAGCSGEDFASILKALGYVLDRRAGPAITVPLMPMAPVEPLKPTPAPAAADSAVADQDVPAEESTAGEPVEGLSPDAEAAPVEAEAGRAEIPVDDGTLIDGTGVSRSEEVPAEPEAVTVSDAEQHPAAPAPAEPNPAPDGEAAPAAEALVPDAAAPDAPAPNGDTTAEAAPVDAASDAAPSEASAETAGEDAAPDEPAAPAEPVLIEVWRPHRTNHHAQRRPDGRGPRRDGGRPDGRRGPPQAAGEGAVAAEGNPGGERRDDRRGARPRPDHRGPGGGDRRFDRDRRPQPATATDGSAPQASAEATPGEARAARPARDFNAPPRNGGAGKPRFEGRGGGDRGGPRRDGRRDEGRGPQNFSTEAPRPAPRDRQPDPNSPFAKLMALKAEMERGKKES